MKKITTLFMLGIFSIYTSMACPVCERNQPRVLRGIVHGQGPDSQWDYPIIIAVSIVVLATAFWSIKWLIRPGERHSQHIKRTILDD